MLRLLMKSCLQDLHVSPSEYNTALALYFIAYVIFEVPANVSSQKLDDYIAISDLLCVDYVRPVESFGDLRSHLFARQFEAI